MDSRDLKCLMIVLAGLFMSPAESQEVEWFKLMDYGGYMETRHRFEDSRYESTGVETTLTQLEKERELGFSTRSYVYHPKLLEIFFSGSASWDGVNTDRNQISAGTEQKSSSDLTRALWDIDAQLRFLQQKRYPFTLRYFRQNPLITTGLEGSFNQETQRYGVSFALRDLLPVNLTLNANRSTNFGETLDRIIDSTSDQVDIRAIKNFSNGGVMDLTYYLTRQDSRNGDPRREIQETRYDTHRATLNSRWHFGSDDQFYLTETANFNRRTNPQVMDVRFSPNLRWDISERLNSTFNYDFNLSDRIEDDQKVIRNSGGTSLEYVHDEQLRGVVRANAADSRQTEGVQQRSYGIGADGFYKRSLSFGDFNLAIGGSYDNENRESGVDQISVRDESHQLTIDGPVTLAREFVIDESIVVRNEDRTQTFIEDVDYRVTLIGAQIEIERLAGGAILDGETVLIDYEVQTGGSFSISRIGHKFIATLDIGPYYSLSLRHTGRQQSLESGLPTIPLNSYNSLEIGARANVPLPWYGIRVGGDARYFRQDEDINPFDRIRIDTYMQIPLPYRIDANITARRYITNNKNSDQDQDAIGFTGLVRWRVLRNLQVALEGRYEEDTGSTLRRLRKEIRFIGEWRFRRLSFNAEARYQQQQQGDFNRDELTAMLFARRELF